MAGGGGIGKLVKSVGGSLVNPGNALGSVVGSIGGVGSVLGPAIQLASGANPLAVFGASLAGEVGKSFIAAGGDEDKPIFVDSNGNVIYATPGADYGSSTYRLGKKALDADPYFIEGNKGIYNLLPELANVYGSKATDRLAGTSSYNVYQNIYNRMVGDELAQQRLAELYGPKTLELGWSPTKGLDKKTLARLKSGRIKGYDFTYSRDVELPTYSMKDLRRTAKERETDLFRTLPKWDPNLYADKKAYKAAKNEMIAGYDPEDMLYVDWGFGKKATKKSPWEAVANYAAKKDNPFFLAFDPNTGETVAVPNPEAATGPATEPAPVAESAGIAGASSSPTTAAAATPMASGGIINLMRHKTRFGKE